MKIKQSFGEKSDGKTNLVLSLNHLAKLAFLPTILLLSISLIGFSSYSSADVLSSTQTLQNQQKKKIASPLRIAVATNFSPTLASLIKDFEQQKNIKVQLISSATGTLFQQIMHGAPFDVFLSADSLRPHLLIQQKKAIKWSLKTYTIGSVSFWSNTWQSTKKIPTLEQLVTSIATSRQRIAIANPNIAPYGKAAKEVLEYNQLWQSVSGRLITGINIGQTFQQVRSQAINLGIIAKSQLVQNKLIGIDIPTQQYQAIEQQLVILTSSRKRQQAQQFIDFLLAPATQDKLSELGYRKITDTNEKQ